MIVGVDIGGTFTDFICIDNGKIITNKVLSTPKNPSKAVLEGLRKFQDNIKVFIHGTTVGTNAVLERKGAKTAFIATSGFKDIIHIGRQTRPSLYNLEQRKKIPIITADSAFEVDERIDKNGNVLKSLNEDAILGLIKRLKEESFESVAICLLFSFINSLHEQKLENFLKREGFDVSASYQVLPQIREYERASTTVVNAYISPLMKRYLSNLQSCLRIKDLRIMQSNGGSVSFDYAKKRPVCTILSGPAAGVVGAFKVAQMSGLEKIITLDMGGTSTDVALCDKGIGFASESKIGDYPLCIPVIDIHTIGAGGGSIAYLDSAGALKVGPESAGSDPGPSCYGKSQIPTVTDANVVLERLDKDYFLGGRMKLKIHRSFKAIEKLSLRLNLSVKETAMDIIKVVNSNMERAIRLVSIERGHNPAEFTLVAFGGAGPLHAAYLIEALNIPYALIPMNSGLLSAFGLVLSDTIKDFSRTISREADIKREFKRLLNTALKESKNKENLVIERFIDARYQGQSHELILPYEEDMNITEQFHLYHHKNYGYSDPTQRVEVVNIRIRLKVLSEKIHLKRHKPKDTSPEKAKIKEKEVYFDGLYKTPIYNRPLLKAGNLINGPAIIVEETSTILIPPYFKALVDQWLNIIISKE
jgi:N-methylhydantoinase A